MGDVNMYLTFDCYGTLLNEEGLYSKIAEIADGLGVDGQTARKWFITYLDDRDHMVPYLDYDRLVRQTLTEMDKHFDLAHKFEEHYVEVLQAIRDLKPFPEVVSTLNKLIKRGDHLIAMSNSSWPIITANVAALENPFEDIIIAETTHAYKPDLQFFQYVQKKYNFTAENHIHIAQGFSSDIVAAKQMGWPSIWVNRANEKPFGGVKPTHTVKKLDEVLNLI
ncbi:HAD family hydrolase [Pediococcus ethanolidurans]|nr:HAD family hydrolase [Pediococcus ethanolidurans]MBU7563678.1 HAD family hydrolase [Pediococcus ethanolidurans]MCT4397928.1 HAD family hydrolase [Pediococcus ethanolidurans]